MNRFSAVLTAVVIFAGSALLHASEGPDAQVDAFRSVAAQIRGDLAAGDVYPAVTPDEQQTVLRLLTNMEGLLSRAGSVDRLSGRNKMRLFNSQEQINNILTAADARDRLVCERARITGTHRQQSLCMTIAERDEKRGADKQSLLSHQRDKTAGGDF